MTGSRKGREKLGRVLGLALLACAQTGAPVPEVRWPQDEFRAHRQRAQEAQRRGDSAGFLQHAQAAADAAPNHPGVLTLLARANALNGRAREAGEALFRVAALNVHVDIDSEATFDAIRSSPALDEARRRFSSLKKAIGTPSLAFTIEEANLLAEGIAHDGRAFFVGSVHKRKIVRIDNGVMKEFATAGLWSVLGLAVHEGRLWACTSALPAMAGFVPELKGRSALVAFDLATGAEVARISPRALRSPQGLAVAEGHLYVADYSRGIARIDRQHIVPVATPPELFLGGIDGLHGYQGDLLAIQNGIEPHRVLRLALDGDRVRSVRVLAMNDPRFDEPTLGVVVADGFFFVANSQWGKLDKDGRLGGELRPPVILRLGL